MVAHWKFDENSSTTTAVNSQGNFALNGIISVTQREGQERKVELSTSMEMMTRLPFHTTVLWPLMSTRYRCGIFLREIMRVGLVFLDEVMEQKEEFTPYGREIRVMVPDLIFTIVLEKVPIGMRE